MTAAPSPITRPRRSAANGRLTAEGSSPARTAPAPDRAKPVSASLSTIDSVAPATAMSHWPVTSRSRATEIAVAPDEQAVQGARLGPVVRSRMATSAAAILGIVSRVPSGEVESGPRSSSATDCSYSPVEPALLVPMTTATRVPSQASGTSPASATASAAASTASLT